MHKKTCGELGAAKVEGERERGRRGKGGEGLGGGEGVTTSKLNLVDLAGSEKGTAGTSAGGAATLHKEGCYINKSLTFLEQVCPMLSIHKKPRKNMQSLRTAAHGCLAMVPFVSFRSALFRQDCLGPFTFRLPISYAAVVTLLN